MLSKQILAILLSAAQVASAPADGRPLPAYIEARKVKLECKVLSEVVNYFTKYASSASSFCTAYLQTSTTTTLSVASTSTKATTTTPPTFTITTTVTSTSTTSTTTTSTSYNTAPNTFQKRDAFPEPTAAPESAPIVEHIIDTRDLDTNDNGIVWKRDGKVPYPVWLPKAILPALVSSACSCFIVPPAPKTLTSTKTTSTATTTLTITAATPLTTVGSTTTTTTTTTTISTTTTVAIYCGVAGCSNGDGLIDSNLGTGTLADCQTHCESESNCETYHYSSDQGGTCNTFSVSVADTYADGTSGSCSAYHFYDVHCQI